MFNYQISGIINRASQPLCVSGSDRLGNLASRARSDRDVINFADRADLVQGPDAEHLVCYVEFRSLDRTFLNFYAKASCGL